MQIPTRQLPLVWSKGKTSEEGGRFQGQGSLTKALTTETGGSGGAGLVGWVFQDLLHQLLYGELPLSQSAQLHLMP